MVEDASKKNEIRFNVSDQQFAYLCWLKENTVLGRSEEEVARHILTQRLTEMREEGYRDSPPSKPNSRACSQAKHCPVPISDRTSARFR